MCLLLVVCVAWFAVLVALLRVMLVLLYLFSALLCELVVGLTLTLVVICLFIGFGVCLLVMVGFVSSFW